MKHDFDLLAQRWAFFCVVLAWTLTAARAPAEVPVLSGWAGEYVYETAGRATATGVFVPVKYRLTVAPHGTDQSARLEHTANQIHRVVLCDVDATTSRLVVRFRSFADGSTVNEYGVTEFAAGAELFSIQRTVDEHLPGLKTSWQALQPDGVATSGRFFVRATERRTR